LLHRTQDGCTLCKQINPRGEEEEEEEEGEEVEEEGGIFPT
jgi:hypothetical protein